MSKIVTQAQFTAGEVDPLVYKQTGAKSYLDACQALQNCEIGTIGQARKRKGTQFLLDVTQFAITNSKLYEITDDHNNHYVGLSGDQKFYIFQDSDPYYVITSSGDQVVTGTGEEVVAFSDGVDYLQTLSTPYTGDELPAIDSTLDNDVLILTHPNHPPARIYVQSETPITFAYEALDIYPLPAYDFGNIDYSQFTVDLSVSGNTLIFTFTTPTSTDPGFTSDWVGGQIIGGGTTEAQPLGYAIITSVGAYNPVNKTVQFKATIQIAFDTTDPSAVGSQYSIRQPAWSTSLGWPAKCLFYQNRLWLANTKALENTVFGSKTNQPVNFDVGVGNDTDAIIYTLGQNNSGPILWLLGGKQLEIYTQNYEFACPQDQNVSLAPGTFAVRQQSSYGSSPICKPTSYLNDSYFVSQTGNALINYHFDGIGLSYTSTNVSAQSQHLVLNPVNRAILRGSDVSQDNFIYYLNPDYSVTAFQFALQRNLAALTPINFNGANLAQNGEPLVNVLDICTINNEIFFLKLYTLTGTYALESFVNDVKMDGYISANMDSTGIITGLSMYNGYTMQVTYDNQDFGEHLVVNGQIQVDDPEIDFGIVEVGLNYDVTITPMYVYAGPNSNDYYKNISRIYVDYYQSLDFNINGKLVNFQYFSDIQQGIPLTPRTDTAIVSSVNGWNRYETFSITQHSPFDLQITSIRYQVDAAII